MEDAMTFFSRKALPYRAGLAALLLLVLPASWALAETDASPQALERFFSSKSKSLPSAGIDFQITAGFAVLATGKPDSSGRYAMTAINVTNVATNIYRLDLQLEKPQPRDIDSLEQPYFYTEHRTYYFWYQNGEQIVFKVGGKRVPLPTGRKDVLRVDIHSPDTYSIDRETMLHNLTFNDGPDQIVLQIRFK
jgi:hypothetical protein